MDDINQRQTVVIIGGGLVGSLNAIFFAKTNKFDVLIFERNGDLRKSVKYVRKSINLALSHRGRSALREVGLEDEILKSTIPMYARMIHGTDGSLKRVPYGRDNECILAVDRMILNQLLYSQAEKYENITMKFNHKLVDLDLNRKIATISTVNGIFEVKYDLIVGNDGAFSMVRQQMMKFMRINFSQEYIPHGYKELFFPAGLDNEFLMNKNCLHIWPRGDFMLIGLPNPSGSFTGTLFMPFDIFDTLKNESDILNFFSKYFPDALDLMGKSNLVETFFTNETSNMVTIRCGQYNYFDSCIIMGDAAHAVVPFYGQGMNAGFEDLLIFHDILKENQFKLDGCCSKFTETRNKDAMAICDLSFRNYIEMRKTLNSKMFLVRKTFDKLMNHFFPNFWIPLYTMVTFTRMPYTKCVKEREKQDKILNISLICSALSPPAFYLAYLLFKKI